MLNVVPKTACNLPARPGLKQRPRPSAVQHVTPLIPDEPANADTVDDEEDDPYGDDEFDVRFLVGLRNFQVMS